MVELTLDEINRLIALLGGGEPLDNATQQLLAKLENAKNAETPPAPAN